MSECYLKKLKIPPELQVVTEYTVSQWCSAWMEGDPDRGIRHGVYKASSGLIRDPRVLSGTSVYWGSWHTGNSYVRAALDYHRERYNHKGFLVRVTRDYEA
jgi:hypothetical protein